MNNGQLRALAKPYVVSDGRRFRLKDFDPKGPGPSEVAAGRQEVPEEEHRGVRRAAGEALRAGPLGRAADLPGDGRGRQGQRHQARLVRHGSAGLPGLLVQGAVVRGARPRLPVAHARRRCRSAAASASSTARTTRRSLVVRVHPEFLGQQKLPAGLDHASASGRSASRTSTRFERYLARHGFVIRKFFLQRLAAREQRRRFLERLDRPEKNWKFSLGDVGRARSAGRTYMAAYEDAIRADRHAARAVVRRSRPTTRSSRATVVAAAVDRRAQRVGPAIPRRSTPSKSRICRRARRLLQRVSRRIKLLMGHCF